MMYFSWFNSTFFFSSFLCYKLYALNSLFGNKTLNYLHKIKNYLYAVDPTRHTVLPTVASSFITNSKWKEEENRKSWEKFPNKGSQQQTLRKKKNRRNKFNKFQKYHLVDGRDKRLDYGVWQRYFIFYLIA